MIVIIVGYTNGLPSSLLEKYFPVGSVAELKNGKVHIDRLYLSQKYLITRELSEEETMTYKMLYPLAEWRDHENNR